MAKEAAFKAAQETTKAVAHALQEAVTTNNPSKQNSTAGTSSKTQTKTPMDFSVIDESHGTFTFLSLVGWS